jgi:PKD domain-containing protein
LGRGDGELGLRANKVEAVPLDEGQVVELAATFIDPGIRDSHTAFILWGDGTQSAGIVADFGGFGTVTGRHVYADNGHYPVRVEVLDDAGDLGAGSSLASIFNVAQGALRDPGLCSETPAA